MRRGPKCKICQRPDVAKVNAAAMAFTCAKVSSQFNIPLSSVNHHKRICLTPERLTPQPPLGLAVVDVPRPGKNASPREMADWHCDRVDARIKAAEKSGTVSERELTGLYGAYTMASKHRDRLAGALDITETQIVRSAPWARLMVVAIEALEKDHPAALKALNEAVNAFAEGKQ